jgi:hypothetical protein
MKKTLRPKWIYYLGFAILGVAVLFVCSLIQPTESPKAGEYYYSSFFRNNYTILSNIILVLAAFAIGYFTDLNPLLSGLCLFLVFPITSIIEATIYKGSHNLIPFEFVMHFIMALPTILAAYIGRFAGKKIRNGEYRDQTDI